MTPRVFGPDPCSLATLLSWRFVGTIVTVALVYLATRNAELSIVVGTIELAIKLALFELHERVWSSQPRTAPDRIPPIVLWFTGLSGAGKSTIAHAVSERLRAGGVPVEELDGDAVRSVLPDTGFTRSERDAHIRRIGYLTSRLEKNGISVVASFVSPYEESRQFVRKLCGRFIEVYVATPFSVCEQRDVKGLYAKRRSGRITHFTGADDPYEPPSNPELVLDTTDMRVEDAVARVLETVRLAEKSHELPGGFANVAERSGRAHENEDGGRLELLRRDGLYVGANARRRQFLKGHGE